MSTYSAVEIVNIALNMLGKASIRDFSIGDDSPKAGRISERIYTITRDSLLSEHAWTFAKCTKLLNMSETTHPKGVLYVLPSDRLLMHRIHPRYGTPNRWSIEGALLLIPEGYINEYGDQPYLEYTKRVTTTGLFPAYFVDALSYRIAARLCMPILRDIRFNSSLKKDANWAVSLAKMLDSNTGEGDDHNDMDREYDTFIETDIGGAVFDG